MTVLIVEDEPRIAHLVRAPLRDHGLAVTGATTLEAALALLGRQFFDIAILDLALPDGVGRQVLAALRRFRPHAHVIVVSASTSEADRRLALDSGADGYVLKPFFARELLARVLAVQRRREPDVDAQVRLGSLVIDLRGRLVTLDDHPVALTVKEFDLLSYLATRPGQVFSRDQLLRAVWQSASEWQGAATVTEHVRRLRAKIEVDPNDPQLVRTVRGVGYRLDSPSLDRPSDSPTLGSASDPGAGAPGVPARPAVLGTIVHVKGQIVSADAPARAILGYPDDIDLVGLDVIDLAAPRSKVAARARLTAALAGAARRSQRIDALRFDGSEVAVDVSSSTVDWNGQRASLVVFGVVVDPSLELRRLATGVLTELTDAVIITDLHLHVQSWNQAAETLYGWTSDEVIGRHVLDVLRWVGDEADLSVGWETLQTTGRWTGAITQLARDGSTVDVLGSTTLVRDEQGEPVGIVSVNRVARAAAREILVYDDDEIHLALANDEFEAYYQPVVVLDDRRIMTFEALARWNHPTRGLLSAADFIDSMVRSELIVELGTRVLEMACRQTSEWRRAGFEVELAVNLSARQLADPALVERIALLLAATGLAPEALWVEMTETALVEEVETAAVLYRLAELGVRIAIDDFGTGWASLAYLRNFPVHALKIDGRFVAGVGRNSVDTAIARSILSLGDELDLWVVAKSIETEAEEAALRALGCRYGQGYLYGRPCAASDVAIHEARRREPPANGAAS